MIEKYRSGLVTHAEIQRLVLKTLHVSPEGQKSQLVLHILHKISGSFLDGFKENLTVERESPLTLKSLS